MALAVAVYLLPLRRAVPPPTPPPIATLADVERAAQAAAIDVAVGEETRPAVLAEGGVAILAAPPASSPRPDQPSGPTPIVDALSGVAAVKLPSVGAGGLQVGTSGSLRPGDQVLIAAAGGASVPATYAGRASVPIGTSGLVQYVMDLTVGGGSRVEQGTVLDREGRLVGIVVTGRQASAPAGHVYAVPIEQAGDLLRQAGLVVPPPPAAVEPRDTPVPDGRSFEIGPSTPEAEDD